MHSYFELASQNQPLQTLGTSLYIAKLEVLLAKRVIILVDFFLCTRLREKQKKEGYKYIYIHIYTFPCLSFLFLIMLGPGILRTCDCFRTKNKNHKLAAANLSASVGSQLLVNDTLARNMIYWIYPPNPGCKSPPKALQF